MQTAAECRAEIEKLEKRKEQLVKDLQKLTGSMVYPCVVDPEIDRRRAEKDMQKHNLQSELRNVEKQISMLEMKLKVCEIAEEAYKRGRHDAENNVSPEDRQALLEKQEEERKRKWKEGDEYVSKVNEEAGKTLWKKERECDQMEAQSKAMRRQAIAENKKTIEDALTKAKAEFGYVPMCARGPPAPDFSAFVFGPPAPPPSLFGPFGTRNTW